MKSFLQIVLSIVLGTFLGHGLYNKLINKSTPGAAHTLEVNPPFLAEAVELEQPVQTLDPVEATAKPVVKSEKSTVKQATRVAAAQTIALPDPVAETVVQIKVAPVQKVLIQAEKVNLEPVVQHTVVETSIKQVSVPVTIEINSIEKELPPTQVHTATEEVSIASVEPKSEKRRFLFFQKKNR